MNTNIGYMIAITIGLAFFTGCGQNAHFVDPAKPSAGSPGATVASIVPVVPVVPAIDVLGGIKTSEPEVCKELGLLEQKRRPAETVSWRVDENGNCIIEMVNTVTGTSIEVIRRYITGSYLEYRKDENSENGGLIIIVKNPDGVVFALYVLSGKTIVITERQVHQIKNKPIKVDVSIEFEYNKWQLSPQNKKTIHAIVQLVKLIGNDYTADLKEIEIQGHTDDVGQDSKNMILSQKRADSIRSGLLARLNAMKDKPNLDWEKILISRGYGSKNPAVGPSGAGSVFTSSDRETNRRVELHIKYRSEQTSLNN